MGTSECMYGTKNGRERLSNITTNLAVGFGKDGHDNCRAITLSYSLSSKIKQSLGNPQ